jgi:hypothetical protein
MRTEDDHGQGAANATSNDDQATTNNGSTVPDVDTRGAAIPIDDAIPEERVMVYDPNKPCMDIGTVYPNMVEFRLAVRQFAINEEFALHTETQTQRCLLGSAWHQIALSILMVENNVIQNLLWYKEFFCYMTFFLSYGNVLISVIMQVTALIAQHNCSSSTRRLTTTPTAA